MIALDGLKQQALIGDMMTNGLWRLRGELEADDDVDEDEDEAAEGWVDEGDLRSAISFMTFLTISW